eukprot:450159-Prorocentrum_minimum.AAC.2
MAEIQVYRLDTYTLDIFHVIYVIHVIHVIHGGVGHSAHPRAQPQAARWGACSAEPRHAGRWGACPTEADNTPHARGVPSQRHAPLLMCSTAESYA